MALPAHENRVDDATLDRVSEVARQLCAPPSADARRAALVRLAGLMPNVRVTIRPSRGTTPALVVVLPAEEAPTPNPFKALTTREREVAALLTAGRTNREIATELFTSLATVKDHVHHILAKTGLPNRAAVAGRWRAQL